MMFWFAKLQRPPYAAKGFIVAIAALAALIPTSPRAEGSEMTVRIDEATLLRLDRASAEIIVGNPTIADVAVQSSETLVITGKSFGLTNIIVLDSKGKEIVNTKVSVQADPKRVVTLRKGTARFSYHCTPSCQETLLIGDYAPQFDKIQKETASKLSIVNSSVNGGQSPQ